MFCFRVSCCPMQEMFKEPPKEMPKEPLRPPASDSQEDGRRILWALSEVALRAPAMFALKFSKLVNRNPSPKEASKP